MTHRENEVDMQPRRAKLQRRARGKRTVYGDLPGESARTPSPAARADAANAGAADAAVDAFWRDALDSIN